MAKKKTAKAQMRKASKTKAKKKQKAKGKSKSRGSATTVANSAAQVPSGSVGSDQSVDEGQMEFGASDDLGTVHDA